MSHDKIELLYLIALLINVLIFDSTNFDQRAQLVVRYFYFKLW